MFRAFFLQPQAELEDADGKGVVLFDDFDGVTDVVAVTVGAEQDVDFLDVLLFFRAHGIAHDPRVDDDGLAAGGFDAEGGVAQPGEFDSV